MHIKAKAFDDKDLLDNEATDYLGSGVKMQQLQAVQHSASGESIDQRHDLRGP